MAQTELYEWPPTRSQRAKWALEELGIDYKSRVVDLPNGEQNTDAYRAIQPLGAVPALKTATYTIFESVAIVLQLIDEYPDKKLAPAPTPGSPQRAHYYQWCVFACAEVDPTVMMVFDNTQRPLESMRPPGSQHDPDLAARGRREFAICADVLTRALDGQEYLPDSGFSGADSGFSGADIVIGHPARALRASRNRHRP